MTSCCGAVEHRLRSNAHSGGGVVDLPGAEYRFFVCILIEFLQRKQLPIFSGQRNARTMHRAAQEIASIKSKRNPR